MLHFIVKNEYQKYTCHSEIGLWAHNVDNIMGSLINTIASVFTMTSHSFWILWNIKSQTWNDNLRDLKVLSGWDNAQPDSMAKIECGVESAHHGATYYASQIILHVDSFQCDEPDMYVDG